VTRLQLPERVLIRVATRAGPVTARRDVAYGGPPLAFGVRTFARVKNDYHLGPFFSDQGVVRITREELERSVRIELSFGLMDYRPLDECFALVEIAHWSPALVEGAIERRATELREGRFFSELEAERWGTPAAYVKRLQDTANRRLAAAIPGAQVIRDEWDGTAPQREYAYRVDPSAEA
jgi:hypothetical protein